MNSKSILSQKRLYLDNKVWLVMLAISFLCLGLISYKMADNKSCTPFTISTKSLLNSSNNVYTVGETLIFETSLPDTKEVTWGFGDNSNEETLTSVNIRHKFLMPGTFTVTATIGKTCSNEITVNIKKPKTNLNLGNTKTTTIKIYGSLTPKVGKTQRYISDAVGNAYEWKILDKATFPAITEKYASFTFPKPGAYMLQLTVDHNSEKRSRVEIMVSEDVPTVQTKKLEPLIVPKILKKHNKEPLILPPAQPREETETKAVEAVTPKKSMVTKEIFLSKLIGVVKGSNDVHDFDIYLLDGENTKVLVNDEKSLETFKELCDEIKGKKKIEIKSVDFTRVENNQILQLKVTYKKRGLLGF